MILFSILFYYLNPINNYKLLYYYIKFFKLWKKKFKKCTKKNFFNHYSYVLIIESWQCLNIKNKKYILKPLLVPGLKAYHD